MPNLHDFATWFTDLLLWLPQKIFEMVTDAILYIMVHVFSMCALCDFSTIVIDYSAIPMAILWFLGWFKISSGLSLISCAYIIRFLIRRIPVIG